jgi:hypothetical protein
MISYCLVSSLFNPPVRILRKGRVYTLGRDPACDFPLPSEVVSRRHAEIEWAPKGGFVLRDMGSKNGTLVNGEKLAGPRPLKDGDKLWLGPFSLQYREYQGDISELIADPSGAEQTMALHRDAIGGVAAHGAAPASPAAGFAGKFAGQELLEICHLMALNEKEGTLHVFGDRGTGRILFQGGQVVQARMGDIHDDERAALEILCLDGGRFEFVGGRVQGTVRLSTESLLMEAARRRDEASETARFDPRP